MKIFVHGDGMTPHQPLVEFTERKVQKLDTFYDKILECHVSFKKENTTEKANKCAELRIHIPGDDIVVKKTTESFEESLAECTDSAKRQIIKKKEMEK